MIKAPTPSLWEIKRHIGSVKAKALIVYALACMAELVNVERNLTQTQMSEIADDILHDYGHLKIEEIKFVLKRAVRQNKIFGRLDYAVVMSWFDQYDIERTDICIDISEQADTRRLASPPPSDNDMSFDQYLDILRRQARNGDPDSTNRLAWIENQLKKHPAPPTAQELHLKDIEFLRFIYTPRPPL